MFQRTWLSYTASFLKNPRHNATDMYSTCNESGINQSVNNILSGLKLLRASNKI